VEGNGDGGRGVQVRIEPGLGICRARGGGKRMSQMRFM
jgi:hypothetical protein